MRTKIFLLTGLMLSAMFIYAQTQSSKSSKATFSGYITDVSSGERLQGATISIDTATAVTTSNNYGFYSVTLAKGKHDITINYVGYVSVRTQIDLQQDTVIAFPLAPATGALSSVIVSTTRNGSIQNSTQMSAIDLPLSTIQAMPKLLGETDVLRALQFLPGVMAGNEASSGLYVRGGSPDQNLILLDGVPVYNASHLFGLFSVFNANALQNVQLYKGGFPARYGGRLSSVVDIRMKEGNKNSWHGEGGIGMLTSNLTLEGPLSKGKSSLIISGRTTNWKPLMVLLSKLSSGDGYEDKLTYGFYDLNAKANFYLGPKDHFYISGYAGRDKFRAIEKYSGPETDSWSEGGIKWGNVTSVARWNHQFNKKVFSNTTVHYSRYQYALLSDDKETDKQQNVTDQFYTQQSSTLQDIAFKYDLDIVPNPRHYIRTGLSATLHYFDPGKLVNRQIEDNVRQDTIIGGKVAAATEFDGYVEDDLQITSRLKTNIGLHASLFHVGKKVYHSIQPRLSARYLISDRLSIKGSFVTMNQYIHLLTNGGIGLPTDLWVPVTERIPDQRSYQWAAGLAYTTSNNIEISLEGYYKHMKNVLEYKEGAFFTNVNANWEDRVETGNGTSRGIELLAQKKKGRATGFIGYTLSKADRAFPNLNNGKTFPFHYDRRHDLKMVVNYKLSERTEFSCDWVISSGQPLTIPLQEYTDIYGNEATVYSERNAYRMPLYHRADISFSFNKQKRKFLRTWIIGVYNVYNRQNPFYIYVENGSFQQVSILPVLPSISYRIKF